MKTNFDNTDGHKRDPLITVVSENPLIEIHDEYDHLDSSLEYTIENILFEPTDKGEISGEYQALKELYNSILNNPCICTGVECSLENKCHHGGSYEYTSVITSVGKNELVLNTGRLSQDLIYECFELCRCLTTCKNRLVQYGPRKNLKVIDAKNLHKQKGLITTATIPKGAFICEYAGEIITKAEAQKRIRRNFKDNKMNYIICLNEQPLTTATPATTTIEEKYAGVIGNNEGENGPILQTFIDPSIKGNIGRYLNHSCDPNCEILSVRVNCPLPKLGIFAKRDIEPNEELCFHYGIKPKSMLIGQGADGLKRCLCGAKNCQGYLPNLEF